MASAAAAQPYAPPPSSSTAYWEVPGLKRYPPKGPETAKGIVFWSHGVSGQNAQWHAPPARFIRDFARDGWDVIKVNRNNLFENGWIASGGDHVEHMVELAKKAKADGYRHVIAAGQSYGGAISLEAAAAPDLFFGVIATAPGHGSDACGSGSGGARIADNLTADLQRAIEKTRVPRILLTVADGDECMGFSKPTDRLRRALMKSAESFVFLDHTMPIRGHGAAGTRQFRKWYADCLVKFFDPEVTPAKKENRCEAPSVVPRFLFPADYKFPAPPADGDGGLLGAWSGVYDVERSDGTYERDICIVVYYEQNNKVWGKVAFGAGPSRKFSMGTKNRAFMKEGKSFVYYGRRNYRIELAPSADRTEIKLTITSSSGEKEWTSALRPGC